MKARVSSGRTAGTAIRPAAIIPKYDSSRARVPVKQNVRSETDRATRKGGVFDLGPMATFGPLWVAGEIPWPVLIPRQRRWRVSEGNRQRLQTGF